MIDKLNKSAIGFFGKRVTEWCSPPSGPPELNEKTKVPKDKAAALGLIQEADSHGAFSDNNSRWTYPPTAPPAKHQDEKNHIKAGWPTPQKGSPKSIIGPPKTNKVVDLPKRHFIEEELDDFEKWLKEAEPWSLEKTHLMTLVAEIACTEKLPLKYRTRASALIKSNVDEPIVATAAQ